MAGHDEVTGLDEVLGVGVDRLLRSAEARGQALPAGPAVTTVAVVLLHRDSRVRAGLPEITAALAREILTGILPTLAAPARDDLGVCARVLKALADEQHAARLLSAKKLAKLHAAVDESTADYEEALVAPERTTWERFYARLMRDEGVEVTDESAVRVWLARYRERPLADRKAAFLAATTAPDEIEPTGAASARHARAAVVGQLSEAVRSGVELGVRAFYLPYLYQEDGRDESAFARIEAWVDRVIDGVTAAGLSKALREEFRDLAPSEDILVGPIVAELSDRREDYGGCLPPVLDLAPLAPRVPVPGVNGGDTADTAALVRSAPLLSAAAGLARWVDERGGAGEAELGRHLGDTAAHLGVPEPVMERVARFARAVSMLRVQDGRVAAGEAWSIWREGDADDLLNLAVTSYAAVRTMVAGLTGDGDGHGQACDQGVGQPAEGAERGEREPDTPGLGEDDDPFLASDEDDDLFLEPDEFTSDEDDERVVDGDVPVLFELFGQQGTASVARLAAIGLDWVIQRAREPVLPVPPAGPEDPGASLAMSMRAWDPLDPGAYALPDDDELERLIGLDEPLDADERAELARQARLTALVADRMAGLGLVCRAGDTVMLSSLGERVMGSLASQAGWNVPTLSEVAAAEPAVMARWLGSWPAWARVAGLLLWAGAGERERRWLDLLAACAASPGQHQTVFELLGVDTNGWARQRLAPGRPYQAAPDDALPSPLPGPGTEEHLLAALREAVADPTIGAYALAALRSRGGQGEVEPPLRARAVLLRDRLVSLQLAAFWSTLLADEMPPGPDGPPEADGRAGTGDDPLERATLAAFDEEAAGWPGGGAALVGMLRDVSAGRSAVLVGLATIARHRPDAVAQPARQAAEPASRPADAPVRPMPSVGGRTPSRRDVARRRARANGSGGRKGRG